MEDGIYYLTFSQLAQTHNIFRNALGIPSGMSEQVLKEKLAVYFEVDAEWVMSDSKTYSLCFKGALRNKAVTAENAFKIITDAAKIIRQSIFSHEPKYDFATQQF